MEEKPTKAALIKEFYEEVTNNWNKRYRENVMRIKSGDLDEVVDALITADTAEKLKNAE